MIEYLEHRFLQLHNRARRVSRTRRSNDQGAADADDDDDNNNSNNNEEEARALVVRPNSSCYTLGRLLGPSSIRRNLQRATDRRRPTTGRCISPHDAAVAVARRVDILFLLLLSLPLGQLARPRACVCARACVQRAHTRDALSRLAQRPRAH